MDPEQVKRMVDSTFLRLGHDIQRFGGKIDKIIGDEIVALFGAPVAHADDPERAVRAALAMQQHARRTPHGHRVDQAPHRHHDGRRTGRRHDDRW